MNKDSEDKLTDAIISLHLEIKKQGENTHKELAKVNLALGEMRLSYMKVADEMSGLRSEMHEQIGGLRSEMHEQIGGLRSEMQEQIGGLRSEMQEQMGGLRSDIKELRSDFTRYAESNESRVNKHENRIERLEEKNFGSGYFVKEPDVKYKKGKKKK